MALLEKNWLFRVLEGFPPPKVLAIPSAGIDVSDTTVKYIELNGVKGRASIEKHTELKIPPGVVVSGEIKDPKKLSETLSILKTKYGVESAHASLPEEKGYLFETKVKIGEARNIKDAVEFHLEENVPLSADKVVFDYDIIQERSDGTVRVSVTAMPRGVIEKYTESFERAGLFLESLEIEAQAIARSVIASNDTNPHMIIDYGRSRTGVVVVSRGAVRYTTTVELGGDALSKAIQKHIGAKDIKEAEKIKEEKGIYEHKDEELVQKLINIADEFADEIEKRLEFGGRAFGRKHRSIEHIVLCGGNATVPGIREYLANRFNVRVEIANVWQNVLDVNKNLPDIEFGDSLGFATAIGLALKSMK